MGLFNNNNHYHTNKQLWHKGQLAWTGQKVEQLAIDDYQDCLWMQVKVAGSGASCHVGYRSCCYRRIPTGK